MAKPTPQPSTKSLPAVVIFGIDDTGKPKAGRFIGKHASLAKKAAKSLKLSVCSATKPGMLDLLKVIPVGRLHAQGKAFLPYIKREVFDQIQAAAATTALAAKSKAGPTVTAMPSPKSPKHWDDLGEGHLVLYPEGPKDGWWEAVVLARDGETLTLKYRDFPRLPSFQCHFQAVGLTFAVPD